MSERSKPIKVFLLAGQSNMAGMASVNHLQKLLEDTATHGEYAHLYDETSKDWVKRTDVYCKFEDRVGPLQMGFGSSGRENRFGPELGFGWELAENLDDSDKPILLLKTAWGGKDLAIDFRPPSSGIGDYNGVLPDKYGL